MRRIVVFLIVCVALAQAGEAPAFVRSDADVLAATRQAGGVVKRLLLDMRSCNRDPTCLTKALHIDAPGVLVAGRRLSSAKPATPHGSRCKTAGLDFISAATLLVTATLPTSRGMTSRAARRVDASASSVARRCGFNPTAGL